MRSTAKLYLEDLKVGDEFRSGEYTLSKERLFEFAGEFDPQVFHLDEEAARESLFEGLAASGWHTAAITMRLLVESTPLAGGVIGAETRLKWPRPTRPGETLHVVSRVMEIVPSKSRPERAFVTVRTETLNERDEVCQEMVAKLVVFRRGG